VTPKGHYLSERREGDDRRHQQRERWPIFTLWAINKARACNISFVFSYSITFSCSLSWVNLPFNFNISFFISQSIFTFFIRPCIVCQPKEKEERKTTLYVLHNIAEQPCWLTQTVLNMFLTSSDQLKRKKHTTKKQDSNVKCHLGLLLVHLLHRSRRFVHINLVQSMSSDIWSWNRGNESRWDQS
jgi:hypothetical protein